MKKAVVMLMLLFLGCTDFSYDLCMTQCEKCPDFPCEELCTRLDKGFHSQMCIDESKIVWDCAIQSGCGFATLCDTEIEEFLICEDL